MNIFSATNFVPTEELVPLIIFSIVLLGYVFSFLLLFLLKVQQYVVAKIVACSLVVVGGIMITVRNYIYFSRYVTWTFTIVYIVVYAVFATVFLLKVRKSNKEFEQIMDKEQFLL